MAASISVVCPCIFTYLIRLVKISTVTDEGGYGTQVTSTGCVHQRGHTVLYIIFIQIDRQRGKIREKDTFAYRLSVCVSIQIDIQIYRYIDINILQIDRQIDRQIDSQLDRYIEVTREYNTSTIAQRLRKRCSMVKRLVDKQTYRWW